MIKNYFKLLRVPQWIKNFFVFVPLVFSQHLFEKDYFLLVLAGFAIFCLASSIVYVINDVIDVELDKVHPVKKYRPIASGKISKANALITALVLILIAGISLTEFHPVLPLQLFLISLLNILYSFSFKHIVLLDIFSIAAGFMLRVVAGGFIISVANFKLAAFNYNVYLIIPGCNKKAIRVKIK